MQTSPNPADSRESSTSMRSMAPFFVITSTCMEPCLPMPLPTVATLASSEGAFAALPFGAHPPRVRAPPAVARAAPVRNCLRESSAMMSILPVICSVSPVGRHRNRVERRVPTCVLGTAETYHRENAFAARGGFQCVTLPEFKNVTPCKTPSISRGESVRWKLELQGGEELHEGVRRALERHVYTHGGYAGLFSRGGVVPCMACHVLSL